MNSGWITPTAILTVAVVVGCHDAQRAGLSSAPVRVTNLTLTPVDRAAYDAIVAKHKGKVVLVDFWATWCLPCVEQLPHALELGRNMGDRGLAIVTVSCDEKADANRVTELLTTQEAEIATNLISEFGGSSATMEAFEIEGGAVPFYKVYDRKGDLRQTFGVTKPDEIDRAVEELLRE